MTKNRCQVCFLNDAVTLFDTEALWKAAAVLNHKFSAEKRKYLTLCTLLSNEPDELVELTDVAFKGLTFGMPLPPFNSPVDYDDDGDNYGDDDHDDHGDDNNGDNDNNVDETTKRRNDETLSAGLGP